MGGGGAGEVKSSSGPAGIGMDSSLASSRRCDTTGPLQTDPRHSRADATTNRRPWAHVAVCSPPVSPNAIPAPTSRLLSHRADFPGVCVKCSLRKWPTNANLSFSRAYVLVGWRQQRGR